MAIRNANRKPADVQHRNFKRLERSLAKGLNLRTTASASRRLGRVRQQNTAAEQAVRHVASRLGLRFTKDNRDLPGSPDLANRSRQAAVFVHGCYWHRHPNCPRASTPKTNRAFWLRKFTRNQERDAAAIKALRDLGFNVSVIWECEIDRTSLVEKRLRKAMPSRRR